LDVDNERFKSCAAHRSSAPFLDKRTQAHESSMGASPLTAAKIADQQCVIEHCETPKPLTMGTSAMAQSGHWLNDRSDSKRTLGQGISCFEDRGQGRI
jgi:hypothetical protein